jgi:hypothetical protein
MTHEISGPLAITMTSISRSGRPYVKVVVDNTEALAFEPATIAAVEQLVSMKVCATNNIAARASISSRLRN